MFDVGNSEIIPLLNLALSVPKQAEREGTHTEELWCSTLVKKTLSSENTLKYFKLNTMGTCLIIALTKPQFGGNFGKENGDNTVYQCIHSVPSFR